MKGHPTIAALLLTLCVSTGTLGSDDSTTPASTDQTEQTVGHQSPGAKDSQVKETDPTPIFEGELNPVRRKTESELSFQGENKPDGQGDEEANQQMTTEDSVKPEAAGKEISPVPEATAPAKDSPALHRQKGDRRWIIKQETSTEPSKTKRKPEGRALKWDNNMQKERCEARLEQLKDRFQQARHFSVMGDSCATAEYAKAYIRIHGLCEKDCPEDFLTANGFSPQILENIEKLRELGERRCLTTQ